MSNEPVVTGTDLVRQALRVRNRKLNLAGMARDLHLSSERLEGFSEGRLSLPAQTIQAIVELLWNGHIEFDADLDVLKPVHKEVQPLGAHPPACQGDQKIGRLPSRRSVRSR